MSVVSRQVWTQQPQNPAAINWANPLTRGLVLLAVPAGNRFFDLVSRQFTEQACTSRRIGATIDGNRAPAVRGAGLPADNKFPNRTGADDITSAYSVFWEGSPEVDARVNSVFASNENSLGNGFAVSFDDSFWNYNTLIVGHYPSNIGTLGANYLGADAHLYSHRCAVSWDAATMRFYAKGKLAESGSFTAPVASNAARRSHIGAGTSFFGSSSAGLSVVAVFNRAFAESEYVSLYLNPWQLFAARRFVVPVPAAGGAVPNITFVGAENVAATSADYRVTLDFA